MSKLTELEELVKQCIKEEREHYTDTQELVHSVVDTSIPAYHSEIVAIANERIEFYLTEPEIWAYDGKHTPLNGIVGNLFQHLETIAYDYLEGLKKSEEEDNSICEVCGKLLSSDDLEGICEVCFKERSPSIDSTLPEDGDIILGSIGDLGSKTSVSTYNQNYLGDFDSEEEAYKFIKAMSENYKPNVWKLSDHGNLRLVLDFWK